MEVEEGFVEAEFLLWTRRSIGGSIGRSAIDRVIDREIDRVIDRAIDRETGDRSVDQAIDRSTRRSIGKTNLLNFFSIFPFHLKLIWIYGICVGILGDMCADS